MRQVGRRRPPEIVQQASGLLLTEGARFSEAMSSLAPSTFVPKGVYRFKNHADANQHQQDCLVRGMGLLAARRA
ncbi:MAG: hypothetical protein ABIO45_17925 [Burkholderiaceae bacterium]